MEVQTQTGVGVLGTYLSQAAVLDFILEDEPIGVRWFKPMQDDTAPASCLPGHLPWDVIRFSCRRGIWQTGHKQFFLLTFKPWLNWAQWGSLEKFHNSGNWEGRTE